MKREKPMTPSTMQYYYSRRAAMSTQSSTSLKRAMMRRRRWKGRRRQRAAVVERKVRKLQKIIPGGQGLLPDLLFLRTADYILHLKLQLNLLQVLSKLYSSSSLSSNL